MRAALHPGVPLGRNLCFGGVNAFDDGCVFANFLTCVIQRRCDGLLGCARHLERVHAEVARIELHGRRRREWRVGARERRFALSGHPRAHGLRALAASFSAGSRRQSLVSQRGARPLRRDGDEPATAAAALLCISSIVGPCGTAHLARWRGVADRADGLANITAPAGALEGGGGGRCIRRHSRGGARRA